MNIGNTLGAARLMLEHLPDDTPTEVLDLEDAEFIFTVDTKGRAKRVISKTTRILMLTVHIPIRS